MGINLRIFNSSAGQGLTEVMTLTQMYLIGAVLGVGLAESAQKIQWQTIRMILIAWLATLPVVGVLSMLIFWLLPTFIAN